jgi:REP element-mobilizing transposase RayT
MNRHRKSLRLKHYDYSRAGLYFITICTQNRECILGHIRKGEVVLNDAGKMVEKLWREIQEDFSNTVLHEYVIMPNHLHGIIEITPAPAPIPGADSISAQMGSGRADMESAPTVANIPAMVQSFKRHTTIKYIQMVKQNSLPPFHKRIWQRNYWEHIIRNERSYLEISRYIANNPAKWKEDRFYSLDVDGRDRVCLVSTEGDQ